MCYMGGRNILCVLYGRQKCFVCVIWEAEMFVCIICEAEMFVCVKWEAEMFVLYGRQKCAVLYGRKKCLCVLYGDRNMCVCVSNGTQKCLYVLYGRQKGLCVNGTGVVRATWVRVLDYATDSHRSPDAVPHLEILPLFWS